MIDYAPLVYRVEPMRSEDIDQVMQIEHVAFSAPWSARAYDYELHYNEMAHYFVVRPQLQFDLTRVGREPRNGTGRSRSSFLSRLLTRERKPQAPPNLERPPVIGYGGLWLMVDEAHISTIASHPDWRRKGVGELLLLAMIDRSLEIGANIVTLEVRVSNIAAQTLYRKYGFEIVGLRKGYYSDNGEDAHIMSTPSIHTAEFTQRVQALRTTILARLSRPN